MVLGGQGRYAAASARLQALLADPVAPPQVAAHAAVTLASHRRQQGGHAAARILDARALRLATPDARNRPDRDGDGDTDTDGIGLAAARVDALVGLAADAIGLGEPATAERLLAAADGLGHPSWRLAVRTGWVRAELALLRGRAVDAVAPAEAALAGAEEAGAARHVVKSRLVQAVARAVVHPNRAVLAELDAVAETATRMGLLPLRWPAHLASADLLPRLVSLDVTKRSLSANDGCDDSSYASPNGQSSGAARRRHAAGLTMSVLWQLSDPVGRGLMGESV